MSANEMFEHITKHCTGATNWEQDALWSKELMTTRMSSTDKFSAAQRALPFAVQRP